MREARLPPALPSDKSSAATAKGVIRDQSRERPLPGASIALELAGEILVETMSDSQGAFELPCISAEALVVRCRGFAPLRQRPACGELTLSLLPGVEINATVQDTDGAVPGARVECTQPTLARAADSTLSDEDGNFSLFGCSSGRLWLRATDREHAPLHLDLGERPAGIPINGLELKLKPGRRISGLVLDAGRVQVAALQGGDWSRASLVTTDSSGHFALTLDSGEYLLGALAPDGRGAVARLGIDQPDPITISLPRGYSVDARLRGPIEKPTVRVVRQQPHAELTEHERFAAAFWSRLGRGTFSIFPTVVGDRFRVEHLSPGAYRILVTDEGARADTVVQVETDQTIEIDMKAAGRLLFRTWSAEGDPVDGGLRLRCGTLVTSARARYGVATIRGVDVGACDATFDPVAGPIPKPTSFVAVPGENNIDWKMPATSFRVRGSVTSIDTDSPIEGVEIAVAHELTPGSYQRADDFRMTDSAGAFAIELETLDTYIFARKPGFESQVLKATDGMRFRLTPGTSGLVARPQ